MTTKKRATDKSAAARAAAFMASAEETERALERQRLGRAKERIEALKASGVPERLAHLERLRSRLDPIRAHMDQLARRLLDEERFDIPRNEMRLFALVKRSELRVGQMIDQVVHSEDHDYDPRMEVEVNLLWEQISGITAKRNNILATHQKRLDKRARHPRCRWYLMAVQGDEALLDDPVRLRDAARRLAAMNGAPARDIDALTLYFAKAYIRDVRSVMAAKNAAYFAEIEAFLPAPAID